MLFALAKSYIWYLFTIHYYLLLPNPRGLSEKWKVKSEKVIPKDKSSGIWLRRWDLKFSFLLCANLLRVICYSSVGHDELRNIPKSTPSPLSYPLSFGMQWVPGQNPKGFWGEAVQSEPPVDVRDRGRPSAQFARDSNPWRCTKR